MEIGVLKAEEPKQEVEQIMLKSELLISTKHDENSEFYKRAMNLDEKVKEITDLLDFFGIGMRWKTIDIKINSHFSAYKKCRMLLQKFVRNIIK